MDEERMFFGVVSLSGHLALETMFGNVLRHPHACFDDCTVRVKPNGLSVCVDLVCLLSVRLKPGWML